LIQFSNVTKLISAMERLQNATPATDRFQFSEIEFDVDHLRVVVFNDERKKLMFAVIVEQIGVHFSAMGQLRELRDLIIRAKQHLDANKIDF